MPCSLDSSSRKSETEVVVLNHPQNVMVAVVAGLDAVDRVMQRGAEALDVGEIPEPGGVSVGRYRQGVFRTAEVLAHHLDRAITSAVRNTPWRYRPTLTPPGSGISPTSSAEVLAHHLDRAILE